MTRPDRKRPARARGFAAVELAVLTPIFLFLTVATAEICNALYEHNTLTKAVRDGAQYLARYGVNQGTGLFAPTAGQETIAKNLIVYGAPTAGTALLPGMVPGNVTVAYEAQAPSATNTHVVVTATYQFQPLFGLIPGFGVTGDMAGPGAFVVSIRMKSL